MRISTFGQRQTDRAGIGFRIGRIAGHACGSLAQAIAFADGAAGDGEPLLCDRLLHRGAAAVRDHQLGEVELGELGPVRETVEQRVHGREDVDLVLSEILDRAAEVARIRDQDVERACAQTEQAAGNEGKHVIERQRTDDRGLPADLPALQPRLHPGLRGQQVRDQRSMKQRRTLRNARRAARILQHRDIVGTESRPGPASCHGPRSTAALNFTWPGNDQAGTILRIVRTTKLTIRPLGNPRRSPIEATTTCLMPVSAMTCCKRRREVLEDDDGFGAGVLELMLELARRVERIDVDGDEARPQHGGNGDGILQHIRHHDGDPRAALQAPALQPRSQGASTGNRSRRR